MMLRMRSDGERFRVEVLVTFICILSHMHTHARTHAAFHFNLMVGTHPGQQFQERENRES